MKKLLIVSMLLLGLQHSIAQTSETSPQKETVTKQKIKVFPNPASNVVNILGLKDSNRATIIVSDISGNLVLQREWAIRNKSVSIPIPNLNSGIYVVRIDSKEQNIQAKFYKS